MLIRKIILIMLLSILIVPIASCAKDDTTIDRNEAIMIASASTPSSVLDEADIITIWGKSNWTVYFELTGNRTVTKNELGWTESLNTKFENQGILPEDTYRLFEINIDDTTGTVVSRIASDSVVLGVPGIFNTEPPKRIFLPLWITIVSGTGGIVIGGMAMWLFTRRKRSN